MPNKSFKLTITAGIAMFSIFFGSGNLVFPIKIGTATSNDFPYALIGLFLTGIIVPLLGLFGMNYFSGSRSKFFNMLGSKTAFTITFAMLMLLGPFGVGPRCVLVAFGGIQLIFPELPFSFFSTIFCLIIGFFCWRKATIIDIISKYLTPWLIFSLLAIIIAGIFTPQNALNINQSNMESFKIGLFEGYQTMDLLASFFFSSAIFKFIKNHSATDHLSNRQIFAIATNSSLLGASLLGLFYLSLVFCGAKFSAVLQNVEPQQYIAIIADHVLGPNAKLIVSVTIAFACLTTIIILTSLFAEFLSVDICKKKMGVNFTRRQALILTLSITFMISLTGFKMLSTFLAASLSVIYPALIVFVIANICYKIMKKDFVKPAFWFTVAFCIFISFY